MKIKLCLFRPENVGSTVKLTDQSRHTKVRKWANGIHQTRESIGNEPTDIGGQRLFKMRVDDSTAVFGVERPTERNENRVCNHGKLLLYQSSGSKTQSDNVPLVSMLRYTGVTIHYPPCQDTNTNPLTSRWLPVGQRTPPIPA